MGSSKRESSSGTGLVSCPPPGGKAVVDADERIYLRGWIVVPSMHRGRDGMTKPVSKKLKKRGEQVKEVEGGKEKAGTCHNVQDQLSFPKREPRNSPAPPNSLTE